MRAMRAGVKGLAIHALDFAPVRHIARPFYAGDGVIFTLHRIVETPEDTLVPGVAITASFLSVLVDTIRRAKREIIPLSEVPQRLTGARRAARWACLTFDDGYADNLSLASPILTGLSAPYSVFLVSGWVDGSAVSHAALLEHFVQTRDRVVLTFGDMAFDLPARTHAEKLVAYSTLDRLRWQHPEFDTSLPSILRAEGVSARDVMGRQFLDVEGARAIARDGCAEIGSHTVHHHPLAHLPQGEASTELLQSRESLGRLLGQDPILVAYPYGSLDQCGVREFELAAASGYQVGVTTRMGNVFSRHRDQLLALPRTGLSLHAHGHCAEFVRAVLDGSRNAFMNRGRRTREW